MAKKRSVFTRTKQEMVSLSVKVPKDLKARADELTSELKKVDPSLSFNTSKILQTAYEDAIRSAEQELAELKKTGRGNGVSRSATTSGDSVDACA